MLRPSWPNYFDCGPDRPRTSGISCGADGYFPATAVNPLHQTTSTTINPSDGQPALTVDENGLRTLMTYDAFGQLIETQYHGTSDSVIALPNKYAALTWCNGACTPGSQALFKSTQVQDGTPTQIVTHDMLGRVLTTAQRAQDGSLPTTQTQYDNLGRIAQRSTPYNAAADQFWTTYQYDPLNRVTQKIVPKGSDDGRGNLQTTYTYSGLQTVIQVCGTLDVGTANCLNMSRTTDSMGRYMATYDAKLGVTQYWVDANGHTLALQDANNSLTTAAYNAIGQRTSVSDPNQGLWTFGYDALGDLLTQTDARGIVTTTTYDALSRLLTRKANVDVTGDGVADTVLDSWTYDPVNGIGKLATSQRMIYPSKANGAIERSQTHLYDTLARPIETDTVQQISTGVTKSYTQSIAYDSYYGWPKSIGYPNGEAVATLYSKYGQPIESFNPGTGAEIYRVVTAINAREQPTVATLGNGVLTDTRSYRPQTGQPIDITTTKGSASVRELDYQYDIYGNPIKQTLNAGATVETYTYDPLQRMTNATRSGAVSSSVNYAYDQAGNFTSKTDFSVGSPTAYTYTGGTCGGGANAVKSVALAAGGTRTYCYDANGNLTSDNAGLSVKYDHDNLAFMTTRGAATITMAYGPDNLRTREWGNDGTKVYLDGGYEDWITAGSTKVYVGDDAVVTDAGSTRTVNYMLIDRLGSVDSVTDVSGNLVETRGSDAFGKPRNGSWADVSPPQLQSTAITEHGFTGHAHLNAVQLIHMNGRVYDYQLGRFLSVDPHIDAPLNSQSLNPYSYIMNNPLAGTDPTGYDIDETVSGSSGDGSGVGDDGGGGGDSGSASVNNAKKPKPRPPTIVGSHIPGHVDPLLITTAGGAPGNNGATSGQGTNATSTQSKPSGPIQNASGFNPSVGQGTNGIGQGISDWWSDSIAEARAMSWRDELPQVLAAIPGDGAAVGVGIRGATAVSEDASVLSKALSSAAGWFGRSSGVWDLGPGLRGEAIEKMLGQNLPQNFPVIDKWANGVATSIKSIDLGAATYQKETALSRTLTGYVDKLAEFNGTKPVGWAGVRINSGEIAGRALNLAVPGRGSPMQQAVIQDVTKYAASRGVKVNVSIVR